ncbi:MAG: hypothetical protein O6763_07465 [Gammaproteobacteria bacterium]|nr:hypothetical protein [Gammaproteobacteria bacterium]
MTANLWTAFRKWPASIITSRQLAIDGITTKGMAVVNSKKLAIIPTHTVENPNPDIPLIYPAAA